MLGQNVAFPPLVRYALAYKGGGKLWISVDGLLGTSIRIKNLARDSFDTRTVLKMLVVYSVYTVTKNIVAGMNVPSKFNDPERGSQAK